jgi:hypothetical protein
MITGVQAFIDAADAGAKEVAADWLLHLPAWQIQERFKDFSARCPDRVELLLRRPANALNVEVGGWPLPRCRLQTPREWGDADPWATRWLASGGSPLVLEPCACSGCPRANAGRVP